MAGWRVGSFKGIAPRESPLSLLDDQAQVAVNCRAWGSSLKPIPSNTLVASGLLPKAGIKRTIYRAGGTEFSPRRFWLHWIADVDVCKSAIFGDELGRIYYTDGELPKVTTIAMATTGAGDMPIDSYTLGIPAPTTACTATAAGSGSGIAETRVYTYTYVSEWGEEGKPATVATAVNVLPGQTVNLTNLLGAPTGDYNITKKRIYRTATVGASAVYLFVAEIAIATTTYSDAILTENLGETLPSNTYSMPPAKLKGLVSMPNGMMAGFVGQDVYFCEPYKPHAWPVGYVMTVADEVVALGVTDTTLIVMTTGNPCLLQGGHPDSMSEVTVPVQQACISKRSVVYLAGSVVYASPDGLIAISSTGSPLNITEKLFSSKGWNDFLAAYFTTIPFWTSDAALMWKVDTTQLMYSPVGSNLFHAVTYNNMYVGFYELPTGEKGGFVFDPQSGAFTMLDFYADAAYYDQLTDKLFLAIGDDVYIFSDNDSQNMVSQWQTKDFLSQVPISMGAIKITAISYPVSADVYADGSLVGTISMTSGDAQRLPSGFLANIWSVKVTTSVEVFTIAIAQRIDELRNA